jgi:hypothetical protein
MLRKEGGNRGQEGERRESDSYFGHEKLILQEILQQGLDKAVVNEKKEAN